MNDELIAKMEQMGELIKALTKKQKACVSKIENIMNSIDESQLKVEKQAFDAINSSDTTLGLVKEGIRSVADLSEKSSSLYKAVSVSSQNITQMEELSNMIYGFANIISGISNKTNMLSLNASIEAARAGEHGKGFAVVASQVRELAFQSSKSSKEIENTVSSIRKIVESTVEGIKEIFAIVEQQNRIVDSVDAVFNKILNAASISNDVSRNVEHEIAYQRDVTDSVKKSVIQISEIVEETEKYTEEL